MMASSVRRFGSEVSKRRISPMVHPANHLRLFAVPGR
jgi:hypothetical protein